MSWLELGSFFEVMTFVVIWCFMIKTELNWLNKLKNRRLNNRIIVFLFCCCWFNFFWRNLKPGYFGHLSTRWCCFCCQHSSSLALYPSASPLDISTSSVMVTSSPTSCCRCARWPSRRRCSKTFFGGGRRWSGSLERSGSFWPAPPSPVWCWLVRWWRSPWGGGHRPRQWKSRRRGKGATSWAQTEGFILHLGSVSNPPSWACTRMDCGEKKVLETSEWTVKPSLCFWTPPL